MQYQSWAYLGGVSPHQLDTRRHIGHISSQSENLHKTDKKIVTFKVSPTNKEIFKSYLDDHQDIM